MLAHSRYRQTQNETASAPRILVLLLQRARRDMALADELLAAGKKREAAPHTQRALDIVAELNDTLDAARAPALAEQLTALYGFIMSRLLTATRGDRKALAEAMRTFAPIADGFEQAVTGGA